MRQILFAGLTLIVTGIAVAADLGPRTANRSSLTFDQRVDAAEALERARFSHRVAANGPFERLVPRVKIEEKVRDELRKSVALSTRWRTALSDAMLRAEVGRMVRDSRQPDRLLELFEALGNDPTLIEECLARPIVVDRLTRAAFEADAGIHATSLQRARTVRALLASGSPVPSSPDIRRTLAQRTPYSVLPVPKKGPTVSSVVELPRAFVVERVVRTSDTKEMVERYEIPKLAWGEWWVTSHANFDASKVVTVASPGTGPLPAPRPQQLCGVDDTWDHGDLDSVPVPRAVGSGAWTGDVAIIWGGFSEIGRFDSGSLYDPATDTWRAMSRVGAPQARMAETTVWTGREMIVWGGLVGQNGLLRPTSTGGRYDPLTDTWSPISTVMAPAPRSAHTAVWTGREMIVWGGKAETASPPWSLDSGARYDPETDSWTPTPTSRAPAARQQHGAVWTGREMVVWGGWNQQELFGDGARYDPVKNTWTSISSDGGPGARVNFSTVWTGRQMLVWGGYAVGIGINNNGARYDPATNRWTFMSIAGAPTPREYPEATWTGSEMLVVNGMAPDESYVGTGGRYDPTTNRWRPMSTVGAPSARLAPITVWAGEEWIVWGGGSETQPLGDGRRYRPSEDRWVSMSGSDRPPGRTNHSAMWTGNLVLIWGGLVPGVFQSMDPPPNGLTYDPATESWSAMSDVGAPDYLLDESSVVWTGQEMIVWGGSLRGGLSSQGWRYDPTFDTWSRTSSDGAPTARYEHTAVWTGREMIVWGGNAYDDARSPGGGRYDPSTDRWSAMSSLDASLGRSRHIAFWTGAEMLVWGGWVSDTRNGTTGALFDPESNSWRAMTTDNAPESREYYASAWTRRRLVVWGGHPMGGSRVLDTGAQYDPALDRWTSISVAGAPSPRSHLSGVWNGEEFFAWGGSNGSAYGELDTGGFYDPESDTWRPTTQYHAPEAREGHSATLIGNSVLIWGGYRGWFLTPIPNSGGRLLAGLDRDDDGDGYTECQGDCNDSNPGVRPGALEACNGLDDDCDGLADRGLSDSDQDGVPACRDNCLSTANPDQREFDGDGIGDVCESGVVLADADNSGRIDGFDLAMIGRAFGSSPPMPAYDPRADFDRNSLVDGDDLSFLASYWGRESSP